MSDGITGWSDEGCCEPQGCKPDTIYEARVDAGRSAHRIYFLFSNSKLSGKCVSIGEGIRTGPEWHVYHIGTATEVHHTCPEGTWILYLSRECYPVWAFREKGGRMQTPTISLANEEKETDAQKAYREMVEEEKYGSMCTPAENVKTEVKKVTEWYKRQQAKERRIDMVDATIYGIPLQTARRHRQGIITSIKEEEVKKKMFTKSLYHIMFFNKKTEAIDFKEYIPAKDTQAAVMIAAQTYKDYNPDTHMVLVKVIDYSEYTPIKE